MGHPGIGFRDAVVRGSQPSAVTRAAFDLEYVERTVLVGSAYYLVAVLGLRLALVGHQVTPVWPPTGLALVGFLIFGRRVWPGVAVAAFLVNFPLGPSTLAAVSIAVGNTLAPLFAATLLQKADFRLELNRLRDALAIVFFGALLGMAVSATWGSLTLVVSGGVPTDAFWPTWWVWWAGDAMGVLAVAPFLLSLRSAQFHLRGSWRRRVEAVTLFAGLAIVASAVFRSPLQAEYFVFPFLVWAGWRFGQRGAAPAALLTIMIATLAAVHETGTFANDTLLQKMATLQLFNASVALVSFLLAAIVAERTAGAAERRRAEEELEHMALHDPLTGLANRALFVERLTQALARTERRPSSVAVLFLDLDRFKTINDNFGHEIGDRVLACIGDRLRRALRPEDTASRFGGDEFVALCEDLEDERHVITIANRIMWSVAEPIPLETGDVVITTSIGIAAARGIEDRPEVLLRDADAAVYRAKERGRGRFELFDQDMRARALKRSRTEAELRHAIEADELRLYYQPLVVLDDLRIDKVEALVRWEHPRRGLLLPSEFVPVAEENGLIMDFGSWVLREACSQTVRWEHALPDHRPISIAVNVSPRQLSHPDFEATVRDILEDTGAEPKNLWFEITETAFMDPAPAIFEILNRLRELGFRLAIDDFGTGYSSLSHLRQIKVDELKVDQSFVNGLGRDGEDSSIVVAVVNLAHSLGLSTVAEGVETAEQSRELRLIGCDLAQGHFFAEPEPAPRLQERFLLPA